MKVKNKEIYYINEEENMKLMLSDSMLYDIQIYKLCDRVYNLSHTICNIKEEDLDKYGLFWEYYPDTSEPAYKNKKVTVLIGAPLSYLEENNYKKVEDE